jgi:hypothetical protein
MNSAVVHLLAECGVPNPHEATKWQNMLLVHNIGGVPGDTLEGDFISNRGFNLVVLDDGGDPTHFCKCRPSQVGWGGGTSLAARLSRSPELASIIPQTWSVHSDAMDAEVSQYIRGELLALRIRSMDLVELRAALSDILSAASTLSRHAAILEAQLLDGDPTCDLLAAAKWALDALLAAGISPELVRGLEAALAHAGTVPRMLQHGDLWPRNVLRCDDHWWILDFELYGRVQIPMYDALHLVRTTWDARPASRESRRAWLDYLMGNGAESRVYRETAVHAARAAALTPAQAGGTLVYYVVDIAARLYLRRILARDVAPYLLEVNRLGEWLLSGWRPENLFLSDS